jgi:ATP adenylyltransferase
MCDVFLDASLLAPAKPPDIKSRAVDAGSSCQKKHMPRFIGTQYEGRSSILRRMERLWTPWRYEYVSRADDSSRPGVPEALSAWPGSDGDEKGCVFCNMIAAVDHAIAGGMRAEDAERAAHVLTRGRSCFLCLNAFPYATGHILIVPFAHLDSLAALPSDDAAEMMLLAQRVESVLRAVYRPAGMNFGLNLGEAGGAGIAGHIHMHALPRWIGDTNFMTVTADTRVLPEALDTTWAKIRGAWFDSAR